DLTAEAVAEGEGGEGAGDGGDHGRGHAQRQAVLERHEQRGVVGERPVPLQGESAPRERDGVAVVEGQEHQHRDRRVEERVEERGIGDEEPAGAVARHAWVPKIASSRVTRLATTRRRKTTAIITSARTAPNGQLN